MKEQESYLLIIRYLSNQTNTVENEFLADWISESEINEKIFEEVKAVWLATKLREKADTGAALNKLHAKIKDDEAEQPGEEKSYKRWYAIAASITGLFVISALIYTNKLLHSNHPQYLAQSTKTGQKRTIYLEDGTAVHLAPQSTIIYPIKFSAAKRTLTLDGEAYFEVSKNPHRPFIVHTRTLNVQVLGTHFNVNSYKSYNSTVVSLLEGKVKVTIIGEDADEFILKPGQQLTLNHLNHQVYQRSFDTTSATGWMHNILLFKNDRLSDAAEKIDQMYGVKIVFADQATAESRLYASFKNESLESVLKTIQATGNIDYKIDGNKIYLTLKK
ncbi:MAG TPA: FecR domain-containing protein [Pedobacter sp.]